MAILARAISSDRPDDLQLAFDRMALPSSAREYLLSRIQHRHVLLTGLDRVHGRFFRAIAEASDVPRDEYPHFVNGDQKARPGTALLSGRADSFDRLLARAGQEAELSDLIAALQALFASESGPAPLRLGDRTFDLRARPLVMGVVNVTPDSFSDGGKFFDRDRAIEHARSLVAAGADILDIGGESTRPGAAIVSVEEEISRVVPVISALKDRAAISVDTTKAAVAREALKAGASLVNDISGFHFDAELAKVTADAGAACCLMHIRGTPETMQKDPQYGDVVEEILAYLGEGIATAERAGISRDRILVDPGIGFGKTVGHNLLLLRRLADFRAFGCGVLVGTSRKAFIGHVLGGRPAGERLFGTLSSIATAVSVGGADVLRVHDVSEVRDAVLVAAAVRNAKEAGSLYARPVVTVDPRT